MGTLENSEGPDEISQNKLYGQRYIVQSRYIALNRVHRTGPCYCWLVGFVALRPKSTAMVIAGRSVHLTTLFLGRLEQAVNQ